MNRFEGERWANVYAIAEGHPWPFPVGTHAAGQYHDSRESADATAAVDRVGCVRIKLKPKGAPKLYKNAANRLAWETDPNGCRRTMRDFGISATSTVL